MVFLLIFLIEVFIIFFLSKVLSSTLSSFLIRITKNKELTVHIISFLFLPGVIVHELSHLLMAGVLFVRVGEIEFLPKIMGNRLKLGSVQISNTDPFRRFLIGAAPLAVGLMIFLAISYFLVYNHTMILAIRLLLYYFLFTVINTMFSSQKDMEGAVALMAILLIIFLLFYFLGLRVSLSPLQTFLDKNTEILKQGAFLLSIPLFVNVVVIGALKLLNSKS